MDHLEQVRAVHEFHHEIEMAFRRLAEVMHLNDAGMIEVGEGSGLPFETCDESLVLRQFGGQQL